MLTHSVLVGRSQEVAVVDDCVDAVLAGRPRLVLCLGEAGIGKTRLAEEALTRMAQRGLVGAWGRCDDATAAPPYLPWRQVFRGFSDRIEFAAMAAQMRIERDLGAIAPELYPVADAFPQTTTSPDDRYRQFDAVARLLHTLAATQPLAVIIDDVHWADEASLLLLGHVVAALVEERILLWINARGTVGQHRHLFDRCRRSPHARELHLAGLTDEAIREQLEGLTGAAVDDREVTDARRLTNGNPFFVAEVARLLVDRRSSGRAATVTPGVADAVAARLMRLSPACIGVCRAAAVLGQEFDAGLVASIARVTPMECLGILDEARGAGLAVPAASAGGWRFVHALVRDAIEAGLQAPERAALHARAAEAIEARHVSALEWHTFELARHWSEAAVAGHARRASTWLHRAGDVAMRQLAFEDAAHLYAEALRLGAAVLDEAESCKLLLSMARAAGAHGASAKAFEAVAEAADIARRLGDVDLLAEAALAREPDGVVGFDLAVRRLCQDALAALDPRQTALRARVTARFAETFIYLPDVSAAREASRQALTVAQECADTQALGAALRSRQVAIAGPDDLSEREQLGVRMLELAGDTGDARLELQGRRCRVDAALERGRMAEVAADVAAAERCAEAVGGPLPRFWVAQMQAVLAQAQGRFADCRERADEAFASAAATDHAERFFMRAAVLAIAGRHSGQDDASLAANGCDDRQGATDGEQLARLLAGPGLIAAISRADVLLTAGRLADAETVYRALGPPDGWRTPPHVGLLARALGLEVAIAFSADDDVAALYTQLLPYRGHHVVSGLVTAAYMGPIELWLGKAERHLRRHDAAVTELLAAERACAAGGIAPFAVEAQVELAAARIDRGRPDDRAGARALLVETGLAATRLGMKPFEQRIAHLLGVLDALAAEGQLTRREREIADLVAEGLTNRQIAERLFLSERTAQNHVQHILDKLSLSNRSQVAVWVERSRRRI